MKTWSPKVKRTLAPRSEGAWTLVELLAVVAILGILSAMLFPGFRSTREAADSAGCVAKLRNLARAGIAWSAENDGRMFDAMYWRSPVTNAVDLASSLLPYLEYQGDLATTKPTPLSCPASFREVGVNPDWNRGYSINIYACSTETGQVIVPYDRSPVRMTQIQDLAKKAFFMDGNFLPSKVAERKAGTASLVPWNAAQKTGFYARHRGDRANVVFFDGHVQAMKVDEFPQDRLDPFWGALK